MKTRRIFFSLSIVMLLLGASCRTMYVTGYELKPHFSMTYYQVLLDKNIDDAYKAAAKGVDDLDIQIIQKSSDKLSGLVVGRLADGTKVKVALSRTGENTTQLDIHVGDFANDKKSAAIFEAIQKRLK